MIPYEIENYLKSILKKEFGEITEIFSITPPPPHIKMDASTNFAIIVSKNQKKSPNDIFNKINSILNNEGFECEFASGFINIKFRDELYEKYINNLEKEKPFEKSIHKSKKVIIEFVSANPTGPLHLASASGASIGNSLANLMKELGFDVFKEYYVNDCGNQVELLGQSLMKRFLGEEPPENGYHGEYLIEIAKKLPSDASKWSVEEFSNFAIKEILQSQKDDLQKLGVEFDRWFFESELHKEKLPDIVLKILEEKNMVEIKDGAKWLKIDNSEDKERVLVKSNGTKTYFLNDLAYHKTKYDRGFDWIIDIWGADHHGYIPRIKAGIKALGYDEKKFTVIIHQLVSIKKGEEILKMSKRSGRFHTLRELIEEVSSDGVKFFFTMRNPNTHLIFDVDLAKKQTNENPLYYVQYAHARIASIFEKAKDIIDVDKINSFKNYKLSDNDRKILKKIFWFEKILNQSLKDLSPHHITTYLIELAGDFHSYYEKNRIIDEKDTITTSARLLILKGIKKTLKKGLDIIGVTAPQKM